MVSLIFKTFKMKDKLIYHVIRMLKGKREALDYAIKMQTRSVKNKNENNFFYWHRKIADKHINQDKQWSKWSK
jgi:thioesterase domain-containing protein